MLIDAYACGACDRGKSILGVGSRIQIPLSPPKIFFFHIFGGTCIPRMFSAFSMVCFVMYTSASLAFFVSSSSAVSTGWDS